MTEAEWLAASDIQAMFDHLADTGYAPENLRKWYLWACACSRRGWSFLTDERSRQAVEITELYADGHVEETEVFAAFEQAQAVERELVAAHPNEDIYAAARRDPALRYPLAAAWIAAIDDEYTYGYIGGPSGRESWGATTSEDLAAEAGLLRDVLGNPFRPFRVQKAWLNPTVISLATAIYEGKAFDRLPILADALEDAGCTDANLLNHCRQPGIHIRGCWPVDAVLGKS